MDNKLVRKILLENIINTGVIVIGLIFLELFCWLIGYDGEAYFIRSKGIVAEFARKIVIPIIIEQNNMPIYHFNPGLFFLTH